ncbi:ABC transporter ATP-binding protein [Rossellomorea vietnamensis]|uniref:ABC transporter ATP-binding protein n=1 Tax=Rossellomorea vietnamensis TaxID=218284 RepID=A0A5D4NVN4_9BACI|nr:ABC transporter ATP-binding protein [Rossellomorea vietnamensis]TYS17508.1 ABC transporter ATP-binding protein [Rossellomorea vietnamensis]
MNKDFVLAQVTKEFKGEGFTTAAIQSISIVIPHNQITAVIGPSGSGKSTLLSLLGALDKPSNGSIHYGNEHLNKYKAKQLSKFRYEEIGFVFQQFHLLPTLTALENVLSPLFPHKRDPSKDKEARELLKQVGLSGKEGFLPSQLSGGQQQRVAIARALINNPSWILADEPTGNLDSVSSENIMKLLLDIQKENQCGVIMVTHDKKIAERADRIIEFQDGKILEV